jgi:hypothetical protein
LIIGASSSILARQARGQEHLKRYLCEFDFRYNYRVGLGFTDKQRTDAVMRAIAGKRLTYRRTRSQPEEAGAV